MAVVARVMAIVVCLAFGAACSTGAPPTGPPATNARAGLYDDPGCAAPYSERVHDVSFPESLVVCGNTDRLPSYLISNRTENVWVVHSDTSGVPLLGAAPAGAASARVAAFRSVRSIDQSTSRSLPDRWVIEPGTSSVVQPGNTYGVLEVDRGLQGAWANYLAVEALASKAGTTLPGLMRNANYGKAVSSCVGFGFSAFDLTPSTPTVTQTMIDELRTTTKGVRCAADLDVAARAAQREEPALGAAVNSRTLSGQLSESASTFDRWLTNIGKLARSMPNHR